MKTRILLPILLVSLTAFVIPEEPKEILLWPNGAPGSEGKTGQEKIVVREGGERLVSSIHYPSITPYFPAAGKASGAAIIIAPGGGHRYLAIDHEGYSPAQWFSERGITAFVLKYRLAREENSTYTVDEHALTDMKRAIRLVRSRAKEWGIDTAKIGVMGFSAGGELAGLAAMRFDKGMRSSTDRIDWESSYPNFQVLIYPGGSNKLEVTKQSPPIFLLGGYKDRADIAEGIAQVYLKYKQAGVPAELHIYADAGHGFGMRKSNVGGASLWAQRLVEWLADEGFLKR